MTSYQLIADIGGTNVRMAMMGGAYKSPYHVQQYRCDDYDSLESIIREYMKTYSECHFDSACLAVAGIIKEGSVCMTNRPWHFSARSLSAVFGFTSVKLINDFTAIAYAAWSLGQESLINLGGKQQIQGKNIAVVGPGTGLGVAQVVSFQGNPVILTGEGGHVDLWSQNSLQDFILLQLRERFGRVSVERVLSGDGLVNIYNILGLYYKQAMIPLDAAGIVQRALQDECFVCKNTVHVFIDYLADFCGNLALLSSAESGIFIGGGITPRLLSLIDTKIFRQTFESKGRFSSYLVNIPTYLIVHPQPGLAGVAKA